MAIYRIHLCRPPGYPHSECFREVVDGLRSGLRSLGYTTTEQPHPQETLLLLGAHLLTRQAMEALPASTVLYNLEQLGISWLPDWYLPLAARLQVWDYTPLHLPLWRQQPCLREPALVRVGYAPELRRIRSAPTPDIDVLFYGSITPRRTAMLQQLRTAGLRVHQAFGVYGLERDRLIARAGVVLNLHGTDAAAPFEVVRVAYLLANGKAVVTEDAPDLDYLRDGTAVFPYDGLVAGCLALLRDQRSRLRLAARAFDIVSAHTQAAFLEPVVGRARVRGTLRRQ